MTTLTAPCYKCHKPATNRGRDCVKCHNYFCQKEGVKIELTIGDKTVYGFLCYDCEIQQKEHERKH